MELVDFHKKFVPPYDIDQDGYDCLVNEQADALREQNLTHEQLLSVAANFKVWAEYLEFLYQDLEQTENERRSLEDEARRLEDEARSLKIMQGFAKVREISIHKGMQAQKAEQAKNGAKGRAEKYQPLKDRAFELVNARKWQSRRNAAQTIEPEILGLAKSLNIPLSEAQAEITITGWLKDAGLPANI
jgi:hypothetical protein